MRQMFRRGAILLTALAMTLAVVPSASAQSGEDTGEAAEDTALYSLPQEPVLQTVGEYAEGLIRVTDGTLWGYADESEAVVIPLRFEGAEEFSLGAALVSLNGKAGLLRWDGTFLLQPEYDELTGVGCGLWLGRRDGVWDLLSVTAVEGDSHALESGLAAASLTSGTVTQHLVLQRQDETAQRILVSSLPRFLQERRVPGWQFPLSNGRQTAFSDVSDSAWYARWVSLACSVGLMEGVGGGLFEPERTLTVAEALRLAACLESRARQDDFHLQSVSGPYWYQSSVAYCEASGVMARGEFGQEDLDRPATRAEVARIFAATTPARSIGAVNDLARVKEAVPDVSSEAYAADAIYALYAKGILNGTDGAYSFRPNDSLTRAEAAAMVSRIARPEQRITLW